jgi:DMSO/TMAO reductase YedYZ molybdopterin-dependent catalytic subunit
MRSWTRREFLALGTGGLFMLTGGGVLVRVMGEPNRASTRTQAVASRSNKFFPGGVPTSLPLPLWITRNEDFYSVKMREIPSISLNSWSLTFHGLVRDQIRLTYDEIKSLAPVTTCTRSNALAIRWGRLIGNAN